MVAVTACVLHGVHARAFHHPGGFLVKHLLLFSVQRGVKSFGRFGALLHVRVTLFFHGLHLVQAFGRGHLFKSCTFGPRYVG